MKKPTKSNANDLEKYRFINFAELSDLVGGVSRNALRRWMKPKNEGGLGFPQQYALSANKIVWRLSEVLAYAEEGKGRAARYPDAPMQNVGKIFDKDET